ncbi:MAG: rhomboid family intramembrane serine protease [Rhizomicrobium sp.]
MTWLLVAACVAAFVWELSLGQRGMDTALAVLGFTPDTLSGADAPSEAIGVPSYATIFISMFLHGGFLHLGGNMLYLWIFGNNIEEAMGHARYTLFYFVCGFFAALMMVFIDPHSHVPMIGASGAISGVLGAYMLLYPRARVHVIIPLGIIFYPIWIRAVWVVGIWFGMQLLSAALTDPSQPGTAFWAHVGGFCAGLVLHACPEIARRAILRAVYPAWPMVLALAQLSLPTSSRRSAAFQSGSPCPPKILGRAVCEAQEFASVGRILEPVA